MARARRTSVQYQYGCNGAAVNVLSLSRRQHAFTLVELIVVLLMVAALSAVGLPKFFDQQTYITRGFVDDSLTALRYAHKLALASGCDTRVEFDASGYALAQRSGCNTGNFDLAVPHPARGNSYSNPAPAGIGVIGAIFYFDAAGRPRDVSTDLLLTSVTTITVGGRSLAIEPQTGYIHSS